MSNLDYPISVLTAERDNIHGLPKKRAEQLQRAIDILNDQKGRDENDERYIKQKVKLSKDEVKEIRKGIVNDKNIKI